MPWKNRPRIGLALGAGAARGWAHIGVIRALAAAGIEPDIIVGASIGAVVGGCYAGNKLDELEGFARALTRRRTVGFLDINFGGSGLIAGKRLCAEIDRHLGGVKIQSLERRYAAVATEIENGDEVWLVDGSLVQAMHASYAIPGLFKPVSIKGRWLMDGAFVNPVPVSVCRALGADYVIAVNLHSDLYGKGTVVGSLERQASIRAVRDGHANSTNPLRPGERSEQSPPGLSLAGVMLSAFNITQDRIARSRLAGEPPDASIFPKTGAIGLFEFHRAEECIAAGFNAARRRLEEIEMDLSHRNLRRRNHVSAEYALSHSLQ